MDGPADGVPGVAARAEAPGSRVAATFGDDAGERGLYVPTGGLVARAEARPHAIFPGPGDPEAQEPRGDGVTCFVEGVLLVHLLQISASMTRNTATAMIAIVSMANRFPE